MKLFTSRVIGSAIACLVGFVSLIIYIATEASYAFPGESAKLLALWRGLDVADTARYPFMECVVRHLSVSNSIAPLFGALAAVLVFLLADRLFAHMVGNDIENGKVFARIGSIATTVIFIFTPAVHEAATHLEPRLFDFMWALLVVFVIESYGSLPKIIAFLAPLAAGVMAGFGFCDTPLFLALFPLYIFEIALAAKRRNKKIWIPMILFFIFFFLVFALVATNSADGFVPFARDIRDRLYSYVSIEGWLFVAVFATLPFVVTILALRRAPRTKGGWMQWLAHAALTIVSIVAIATPLSPSSVMAPFAILPVASSAYAAFTAGYLTLYWLTKVRKESTEKIARYLGYSVGGALAVAVLFALPLNIFSFDTDRGDFADKVAERILFDLEDREWLVTDGSIDNHVLLAAERIEKELYLIALHRDLDAHYISRLSEVVKNKKIGGDDNAELLMSLSLGVLPFVQDWFACDPSVRSNVAVWGASDLWLRAGFESVPEFLFFGAESKRVCDWDREWQVFSPILEAKEGWGSYRLSQNKNPIERFRLDLRRHAGLVANNKGVWLEDNGKPEEAFELFDFVLEDVDADNVCALLNEFELATSGLPAAKAKRHQLEKKLKAIVDDSSRRYRDIPLSIHYGYIRSSEMYARYGMSWARSGRPGEALLNFGRAIDLVPTDRRNTLLSMMAAVYASENERNKSREIYEGMLESDASNRAALLGLMRLEIMDGNIEKAIEYLEKANEASGDDPRAYVEKALLYMMKGNLAEAKALLRKATDANAADMQAWSFLAAATIQEIDAEKDDAKREALMKELETDILPSMEKHSRSPSDYYVQTTRAFLLLRKGADKRKEARDALITAAKNRPDVAATSDMILGLDISMNDTVDAERHAREVLRRDRKAPLANYVMGSLALQKGANKEAEAYLRRAADAEKPVSLALNDLAEVLRREGRYDEAVVYARKAVKAAPNLYVAYETLGSILVAMKGDLEEAEHSVTRACELSRDKDGNEADVRMLVSLARIQLAKGETNRAKGTLRKVQRRADELSAFEREEFEELKKNAHVK